MKAAAFGLLYIVYTLIGLVQITATASGIAHLTGLWWPVSWFLAVIFGAPPLIGTGFGIYGAYKDWGWSFWGATGLFLGIPLILLTFALVATVLEGVLKRRAGT